MIEKALEESVTIVCEFPDLLREMRESLTHDWDKLTPGQRHRVLTSLVLSQTSLSSLVLSLTEKDRYKSNTPKE